MKDGGKRRSLDIPARGNHVNKDPDLRESLPYLENSKYLVM